VQLPRGVFTASDVGNPLGDLGPGGNPANLSPSGPASGWCRPAPVPFSEVSPLENHLLCIGVVLALAGVVVFWLSRGLKKPGSLAQSGYLTPGLR